jgi:hypothetical protein
MIWSWGPVGMSRGGAHGGAVSVMCVERGYEVWMDFCIVEKFVVGVLWFSTMMRWRGRGFRTGGAVGRRSRWRVMESGGKVVSVCMRRRLEGGIRTGVRVAVDEVGSAKGVGVSMTIRRGRVLEVAAAMIASWSCGAVRVVGGLIHVNVLVRNVVSGVVCAPRWVSSWSPECQGSCGSIRRGLVWAVWWRWRCLYRIFWRGGVKRGRSAAILGGMGARWYVRVASRMDLVMMVGFGSGRFLLVGVGELGGSRGMPVIVIGMWFVVAKSVMSVSVRM